mmetsp:Transcript_10596/g.21472  ORF Transcript_10596/g.21472 Transcript_10596/m.21472 type:complete len:210 (-) Transcript_10596:312-941(-)
MSTFCMRMALPSLSLRFLSMRSLYMDCCHSDSQPKSMYSYFLGIISSTSALSRRSRKGRRIWCSLVTTPCSISPFITLSSVPSSLKSKSNHAWKDSRSSKMLGRRKLSSDQSSVRLFCSGVPVSSSLLHGCEGLTSQIDLSSRMSLQLRFFSRWPSSMMTNFQPQRLRCLASRMTISYEVISTGNFFSLSPLPRRNCPRISARSFSGPW